MDFTFAYYTDQGNRENNEDNLALRQQGASLLAVVADGLGGHENGEIASALAVDTICRELSGKAVEEDALIYAILNASSVISEAKISGHSTVAALWLDGDAAVAANVGDSRIYQFRDGAIRFQSTDHSIVQLSVLVGELEPGAVRHHKDRNKLFRVLGAPEETPKVDSTELDFRPGDRFLLCSDGFWEPVTEADMLRTMAETRTAEQWLEAMKQIVSAARNPRQDNHTAICIVIN